MHEYQWCSQGEGAPPLPPHSPFLIVGKKNAVSKSTNVGSFEFVSVNIPPKCLPQTLKILPTPLTNIHNQLEPMDWMDILNLATETISMPHYNTGKGQQMPYSSWDIIRENTTGPDLTKVADSDTGSV